MKQIGKDKLCYYCLGCNRLEIPDFLGIMSCKNFIAGKDLIEFYKILKNSSRGEK